MMNATTGTISPVAWALLVKFILEPLTHLAEAYRDLGLRAEKGKRAIDELIALGFIVLHALPRVGRGGAPCAVEVLPAADELLTARGHTRPQKHVKGSWRHNVYALYVARWVESSGGRDVHFEHTLGDKTFDVTFRSRTGELICVEICMTGTPARTAQQLLTALEAPGLTVLALFETRNALQATETQIRKQTDASVLARLQLRLLGEIIQGNGRRKS